MGTVGPRLRRSCTQDEGGKRGQMCARASAPGASPLLSWGSQLWSLLPARCVRERPARASVGVCVRARARARGGAGAAWGGLARARSLSRRAVLSVSGPRPLPRGAWGTGTWGLAVPRNARDTPISGPRGRGSPSWAAPAPACPPAPREPAPQARDPALGLLFAFAWRPPGGAEGSRSSLGNRDGPSRP